MITKLYIRAQQALFDFKKDQRGVTAIEYAVLAVAVSTAVYAAFSGDDFAGVLSDAVEKIKAVTEATTTPELPNT